MYWAHSIKGQRGRLFLRLAEPGARVQGGSHLHLLFLGHIKGLTHIWVNIPELMFKHHYFPKQTPLCHP